MTAHALNIAGFVVAGFGSSLGMIGIFKQTNGYYSFEAGKFFEHMGRVASTYLRQGKAAALNHVNANVKLAEGRGEDRLESLLGLYCVFIGFLFQLIGALLLLVGSLVA